MIAKKRAKVLLADLKDEFQVREGNKDIINLKNVEALVEFITSGNTLIPKVTLDNIIIDGRHTVKAFSRLPETVLREYTDHGKILVDQYQVRWSAATESEKVQLLKLGMKADMDDKAIPRALLTFADYIYDAWQLKTQLGRTDSQIMELLTNLGLEAKFAARILSKTNDRIKASHRGVALAMFGAGESEKDILAKTKLSMKEIHNIKTRFFARKAGMKDSSPEMLRLHKMKKSVDNMSQVWSRTVRRVTEGMRYDGYKASVAFNVVDQLESMAQRLVSRVSDLRAMVSHTADELSKASG